MPGNQVNKKLLHCKLSYFSIIFIRSAKFLSLHAHASPLPQRPAIIPDRLPDHTGIGLCVMGLEQMGGITNDLSTDLGRHTQAVKQV